MDRNKLDPGPTLAEVLAAADVPLYGQGYQSPALGGDDIYGTSDMSRIMQAQQAAKEREGPEAAARLFAMAIPGGAAAHRATTGNLGKAVNRHMRLEEKADNPWVNPWTSPFLQTYLMAAAPLARRSMMNFEDGGSPFLSRVFSGSRHHMKTHAEDTAEILQYLNRWNGPPKTDTLY